MPSQPIKFYQVGSFAAGNRLLDPDQRTVQARSERSNTITSGHRACQGCGEALGARYVLDAAMRATEGRLVAANATGCLEVFSTPYPESSWQLPWLHSLFGNAPAVATGIAAALAVKGSDARVIAQGESDEVVAAGCSAARCSMRMRESSRVASARTEGIAWARSSERCASAMRPARR